MSKTSLKDWKGVAFVTDPTFGDNGKGKVVDLLAQNAHLAIRVNGGANAGHTVKNNFGELKLHLIPSGICNSNTLNILSDTVVIDPLTLAEEIKMLKKLKIKISPRNLLISKQAHMVMPWHKRRDGLQEAARGGGKIGTTGKGIGPTYADRADRVGLRVGDLLEKDFAKKFEKEALFQEKLISSLTDEKQQFEIKSILKGVIEASNDFKDLITDVFPIIQAYKEKSKNILGEAGQGVLLDLDRGTYPFVTSSHPGIAGFNLATGFAPREVDIVIGVTKIYATRVGEGPMPTELHDAVGDEIRKIGNEYGTTTGRPRRCGWLDLPSLRYGCRVGGITTLGITKLDVLDTLNEIKLCVAYTISGKRYPILPTNDITILENAKPVYEKFKGWKSSTKEIRDFKKLPSEAKVLLNRLEEITGIPISLVSVGPERDATIFLMT